MSCQVLQEMEYGLTREIVADVVSEYVSDSKRPSPFKDGIPESNWWSGFLKEYLHF